jgi:hypothetical protein
LTGPQAPDPQWLIRANLVGSVVAVVLVIPPMLWSDLSSAWTGILFLTAALVGALSQRAILRRLLLHRRGSQSQGNHGAGRTD